MERIGKQFQISTLMLLVVIAALVITLSHQEMEFDRRISRQRTREAELRKTYEATIAKMKSHEKQLQARLDALALPPAVAGGSGEGK